MSSVPAAAERSRDGQGEFGYLGQVQSDPQAQFPPQRHPARRTFCVLSQPHVQVAPAQDAHGQVFEVAVLFDMTSSFEGG